MKNAEYLNFRKKWIQWVLDFAQSDLGSLSLQERRKLLREISYFCSEDFFNVDWDEYENSLELATSEESRIRTETDEFGNDLDLPRIQKKTIKLLSSMEGIHRARRQDRMTENILIKYLPDMSSYISSALEGVFRITREPKDATPENWLILNFVSLIEKFEIYPIRKCKGKSKEGECGRYFLNLMKREKVFCTPSCASRSIQTDNRDKLRREGKWEAYVSKMKKYQRERYEEKMRAKLGGKIRVGRRRTRKED